MKTGPNIIQDGLVLGYDADDRSTRFYPGEPTTNLLTYSEDLNTISVPFRSTYTANAGIAPDGTQTADLFQWNGTNPADTGLYRNGIPYSPNTTYTLSAYVKGYSSNYLQLDALWLSGPYDGVGVKFNILNGSVDSHNTSLTYRATPRIESVGNDWYRCSITFTTTGTITFPYIQIFFPSTLSLGQGGYIWGVQFEQKPHVTPYIKTTSSTSTRLSTQSLIDLKKTNTIDLTNVSFDWKGNPYFYGIGGNKIYGLWPSSLLIDDSVTNRSWECVVSCDTVQTSAVIFGHKDGPGSGDMSLGAIKLVGGKFVFTWYDNTAYRNLDSGVTPIPEQYYHIAVTFSGSDKKPMVYVNGVLKATYSTATNIEWSNGMYEYNIGYNHKTSGDSDFFKGNIKIAKFYKDKSLTASEVLQNYNASKGRFEEENRLNEGLVLHLDVNNKNSYPGTGTAWYDLAGSNYGTLVNGPTFSNIGDGSLLFDGIDDYVSLTNTAPGTGPFTISMWVSINTLSTFSILWSAYGSNTEQGVLYLSNTNGVGYWALGDRITEGVVPTVNTWYYVTLIGNGGTAGNRSMKLYKNGVQVGNTYTYDYNFTSTNFLIGTNHSAFYELMHGNISQYKQYSRALPISEIQTLFNNEKSRYGL